MMDLHITTRRWSIRVTRRKPAPPAQPAPPVTLATPMRIGAGFVQPRRAAKDVR